MKYIPIFRLKSIENSILSNELKNDKKIIPLVEVTDEDIFYNSISNLCNKYDNPLVELPLYLALRPNKHQLGVTEIIDKYSTSDDPQISFYNEYKKSPYYHVGKDEIPDLKYIPVLSSVPSDITYSNFIDRYNVLSKTFDSIGLRIFVYSIQITKPQSDNLKKITEILKDNDIILLDVLSYVNVEQQVNDNISAMIKILNKKNMYILNLMDYDGINNIINLGPNLSTTMKISGFGDFATMIRYEPSGSGGSTTKRIRFYNFNSNYLLNFQHDSSYSGAVRLLKQSVDWTQVKQSDHFLQCDYCQAVDNNTYNQNHVWWKRFRMVHYINSILNNTF
jgi:hypothetical protein